MNTAISYTPNYVTHIEAQTWQCHCTGCRGEKPLVKLNWHEEQRVSAELHCDSAALGVLCDEEAFALQHSTIAALAVPGLCPRLQMLNQQAIFLLSDEITPLAEKLYAVGVLLSKCQLLQEPEEIQEVGEELLVLLNSGLLGEAFAALPVIETYPLAALRQLAQAQLDANLDPLTGMTLVMKLNELATLSDAQLVPLLHELGKDQQVQDFMHRQATMWRNYLLWHAYHGVFPGASSVQWEAAFQTLCQRVFGIKVMISLLLVEQCELDDSTLAALFAAWQRQPLPLLHQENALLIGLSLLK
jgi:lysine-N-methylase